MRRQCSKFIIALLARDGEESQGWIQDYKKSGTMVSIKDELKARITVSEVHVLREVWGHTPPRKKVDFKHSEIVSSAFFLIRKHHF